MQGRLAAAGRLAGGAAALLFLCGVGAAHAETAWVRGEVRLNLRAGPGTKYRILRVAKTGDSVTVMKRGDGWTQVSTPDGQEGWIPEGFLASQPPASVRLIRLESDLQDLRRRLDSITKEAAQLREANESLTARDDEQQASIRELSAENLDLKAGERWPYLIAGASILASGMLVGAILYASSTRRRQPRIRF
jgi:uncharacterized protein YgiM (DUF1202 family)